MSSPDAFARPGWTVILTDDPGELFDLDTRRVWVHRGRDPLRARAHVAAHIDAGHWLCAPHGRFSDVQECEADRATRRMLAAKAG